MFFLPLPVGKVLLVRRLAHSALLLSLVALFTVGGMVIVASPASADTGGNFDPSNYAVNSDPLVTDAGVKGTSFGGVTSEGQVVGMWLNKARYAKGWTAITKRLGFGASGISADADAATQLAQLERAYAPLATKMAPVIKVANGVSTVALAAQAGISLGASVDRAAGIDVNGGLCANAADGGFAVVAAILVFAGAADCDKYKMSQELKALENKDTIPGVTGGKSCGPDGSCVQFIKSGVKAGSNPQPFQCIQMWAGPGVTRVDWVIHTDDAGNPDQTLNGYFPLNDSVECGGGAPPSVQQYNMTPKILFYCAGNVIGCTGLQKMSPQAASTDPDRTFRCDVQMKSGATATHSTAVWHESDGVVPPWECPPTPPAEVPIHTTVWETGGAYGDVKWTESDTTPEYQTDRTAHPDCTLGQCRLNLQRNVDKVNCLDAGSSCDGWIADPSKDTNYSCTLGPYTMPLASCNVYAPTFNQQKVAQGAPYGDPTTGADVGQTVPRPAADPGTGLDPQTGSCFPTGWGVFNPIEWIQKPVGCALQTAFVPKQATITNLQTSVKVAWLASTPGQLQSEVESSIPEFASADSGCNGIAIAFPTWSSSGSYATTPEHVLAACPGDFFANWAPLFSAFIGGSFIIGGILGIKRLISAMVGMHDLGVSG